MLRYDRCLRCLFQASLAASLWMAGTPLSAESSKSAPLFAAKSAMQEAQFEEAIEALDQIPAADKQVGAEAMYLKGLAQFYLQKYQATVDTLDAQLAAHPDSDWFHKARFLKARALVALRQFQAAEVIYEQEANRLLSTARKQEIAGVILSFADALATKPDPSDIGALPPDYSKAYKLYGKALEMEMGRDLRDDVMFRRSIAILRAGNHGQAIHNFRAYLAEWDPEWTGAVGTPTRKAGRKRENPEPAGKHVLASRYHLAEAQLLAGQHAKGRVNVEDLLARLTRTTPEKQAAASLDLASDTAWLLVKSYKMPTPAAKELDKAVQVTREFLQNQTSHPRAVQAAWFLPEAFRYHGRSDQAITEYELLIAGKGFSLPPGDAATDKLDDLGKSPAELKEAYQKKALFQVGQIQIGQHDYAAAIQTWTRYITQFPNGPNWADCQRGIVDAEYQAALGAVAENAPPQARKLLESFLAKHPLDRRAAQILYLFGQIDYVAAKNLEEEKAPRKQVIAAYQKAIDRWARVVSKYPDTEPASLALYQTGMIYEEKRGDLEQALATYRRLTSGSWASHARSRLATMTQKHLTVTTERKFRTNEQVTLRVNTRNIQKLTFKQYFLDLEAYFRKTHEVGRVEDLDIDLIQPDKTWEVEVAGYAKYLPIEQQVEIPFDENRAGVCIVKVSGADFEATTLVVRSNLDLIVKSSRRELLVFVQDMLSGKPAEGVKLLVSNGKKVLAIGKTGPDGVFLEKYDELRKTDQVRIFAMAEGSVASNRLDLSGLKFSQGLSAKGYLTTDRPAYQPGQVVRFRGILRDVRDGSYVAPAGEKYEVAITDAAGRLLWEEPVTLSEFGTFHSEFQLDASAPVGGYQLVARKPKGATYSATFQVEPFQLEKLRLTLDTDRQVYFRGEEVKLTIGAAYYWGQPASEKLVRYRLPNGRQQVETTDAEGKLVVLFDTTGMQPGSPLQFTASIEGENVTSSHAAMLAVQGFQIAVQPSRPLVLSGEPIEVEVRTTTPDGEPIGKEVTLRVLRREAKKPNPVLSGVPWMQVTAQPALEVTLLEKKIATDPETGIAKLQLGGGDEAFQAGGEYQLRVSGQDRFEQVVTGQASFQVSDDDDATKLRLFAKSDSLEVGSRARVRLHSRVDAKLALVTFEGETILSYRIVPLKKGFHPIDLEVGHEHFPNFRLTVSLMDGRELRSVSKPFTASRKLNVTVEPLAEAYAPGAPGKVELTVTDQRGRPVRGELSLSLVDEALYAIFPDQRPDILHYFQRDAYRHAEFRETSTCGFHYEATTRAVLEAYENEQDRLVRLRTANEENMAFGVRVDDLQKSMTLGDGNSRFGWAGGGGFGGGGGRRAGGSFGEKMEEKNLHVFTEHAFTEESLAKKPSRDRQAPLREELPDAGWWSGKILTGEDGKAIVEIPMPETTTEWRLTARGVTVDTLVGQATANVLTRKDFFVTVKVPRKLREGDSVRVIARVHNLTDYSGNVRLDLTVLGGEALTARLAKRTLTTLIDPQGVAEVVFDAIQTPQALAEGTSQLRFQIDATADALSDSLVRRVPVQPWGLEFADHAGGVANTDTTAHVELPKGREYPTTWMTLSVGPRLEETLLAMALTGSPGGPAALEAGLPPAKGCLCPPPRWGGHAGSDLLAVTSALSYAKKYAQGATVPQEEIERLTRRARSLVSALVVSQRDEGGWSWRGRRVDSDWGASSRSFWALSEARRFGISVDDATYKKAQTYLQNRFTSLRQSDNDAKAVVLHALSTNQAADFAPLHRLHRERHRLSAPALAYTAMALANLDRNDHAGELLDVLEKKAKRSGKGISWEGASDPPSLGDQVETTALAAFALLRVRPTSTKAAEAIAWLLDRKGVEGFASTKANGPAMAALTTFYSKGKHSTDDYRLKLLVNGKLFKTLKSQDFQQTLLLAVPKELLKTGENQVDFQIEGRGEFAYAVSLRGFSRQMNDPSSDPNRGKYPFVRSRTYQHAPLEYRGRLIGPSSSSPVQKIEVGQRVKVHVRLHHSYVQKAYVVVEEPLPAGLMLVDGSLTGSFDHHRIEGDRIVLFYQPDSRVQDFHYELIGYASGTYRAMPTVVRNAIHPERMRLGKPAELVVLAPGEKSDDPYQMNSAERFALGKLTFDDGLYKESLPYLAHLFQQNRRYNEQEVARRLLWIYTTAEFYDAPQIVQVFEVLRERFPTLEIPYDKILSVGQAYRDMGEFERAYQVYRATVDASFINDSNVSAVLEDEGDFLGSIDYQENLWRDYPDTAPIVTAYFAISQSLYQKAPEAHLLAKESRRIGRARVGERPDKSPTKVGLLEETIRLLSDFLTLYPTDPLADDAAFSRANALLDLKQYELVVEACDSYTERFADSDFRSGFQYMIALGHFWQRQHDDALAAAQVVANGKSKDRDLARYILGQIHHAENDPASAIEWYRQVALLYSDAQQAIDYFEAKHVAMDEVNVFKPGEKVEIDLRYRNIVEARCQVYRVDLMRLYLREKNLANVTKVHLAGIAPLVETTLQLGDGKDYANKERTLSLDLDEEGAYLVICRGDDLFASALVLVTPLEIVVQEDATSGRVRANVIHTADKRYVPEVHVKAIGSADSEFRSGETDLRGLFIADGVRGTATVIAREGESRYAFYRGETWLGAAEQVGANQQAAPPQKKSETDYKQNLFRHNTRMQKSNFECYDQMRRGKNKGVEVQQAQ